MSNLSVPTLKEFNPGIIDSQYQALKAIRTEFDYKKGVHEVLLSGSVGSSKSLLLAHLAVTHCLFYPGAGVLIGRRSMPSLKDTLFRMIIDHLGLDTEYKINTTRGQIDFPNGSKIYSFSWADKLYKKVRSYALSMALIEELTENDEDHFYKEIKMRVNRIQHVPEKLIVCATNPDAPSHWAYDYFIDKQTETRRVFYSLTEDNPFLDKEYINGIKETLTAQEVKRMLYGQWIEISREMVYYAFDGKNNVTETYQINPYFPIIISYDFNVGLGKPMSVCLLQYINGVFYVFDEVIIHGSNTAETIEEIYNRGYFHLPNSFIFHGDASGSAKSSKYHRTDYEVIKDSVSHLRVDHRLVDFTIDVPGINPPVRKRHILVNGVLKNSKNQYRVKIVKDKCPTLIKGLRLTKLKKGGYIEDDSDEYQHITTALGYGICRQLENEKRGGGFNQRKH